MKVRICNLLRVTTYLELLFAILIIADITYELYLHSGTGRVNLLNLVIITGAALQTMYSIAVVRLIHYYASGQKFRTVPFCGFTTY